ncbi:peroxidase [Candidatus Methylomirabilis lanthanidiphila]|uniref:Peroxidase n=1 Tax=Candidatus Methylomirabilis lanthanidiphila TaxID=2211376 RepID=A0A564ZI08_9BACT|nr:Dyp-type peroxidase [Candidatus Methylomirabilis lanthanidiphila]VUZ84971.1 peroxidase [Candidatus Methylomirabilis lanthanidiphila]
MDNVQSGILESTPSVARYLIFSLTDQDEARQSLRLLSNIADGRQTIVGFGQSLVRTLGATVPGLRTAPSYAGAGYEVPSTPFALWCWLRGDDRGELLHRTRRIDEALAPAFRLEQVIDAFIYGTGRDLTGYEDGTENPKGEGAAEVAFVQGHGEGLDGSSFVAVQQWVHDLDHFEAKSAQEQDYTVGRRRSDNDEIEDAPPSAHIKRTAQESFDPAAFVLRRSMPWTDDCHAGLVFVAFGASFDAFEALLRRMVGADDGIVDALFSFTRPISGAYFWCPRMQEGRLDLRLLGV